VTWLRGKVRDGGGDGDGVLVHGNRPASCDAAIGGCGGKDEVVKGVELGCGLGGC
jgi:hypothetical protein